MSTIQKKVLCYAVIVIAFILLGNTNNDMTIFIQRIFPPVKIGEGTLYYAAAIPVIFIYYALKQLNELDECKLLKTGVRRIIVLILALAFFVQLWESGIKGYKSMLSGLESIYFVHEVSSSSYQTIDSQVIFKSDLEFENCGDEPLEFKVQIKVLDSDLYNRDMLMDNFSEDVEFIYDEIIYLPPNGSTTIQLNQSYDRELGEDETNTSGPSGPLNYAVEYILFNDEQEVVFTID